MPAKQEGFVTTFKWLGTKRAMVSCNGVCEDFSVDSTDLESIWKETMEKSELLRGLNLSRVFDEEDGTILFVVDGYSDAHAELVSQLRSEVSEASTELDNACRAILDCSVGRVNVAIEAHEISKMLRRRADVISKFADAENPASDTIYSAEPRPDPFDEMQWMDDGGSPADAPLAM